MTPQEQEMLQGLIQRVNQTRLEEKDTDAEAMLNQTLGHNPDALYILAQTVLVQQYALDQAKQQLDQLRQQQQPHRPSSFLGGLLGRDQQQAQQNQQQWQPVPLPPPPPAYAQPQYVPAPAYAGGFGGSTQGGFLRGAMQTAAGVAAGALAFEGIESLMHGFDHAAGYGQGFGGFGNDRPEIINNYYGDSPSHEHTSSLSPDIEDRRNESPFSQAVDNNDHGDSLLSGDDSAGSGDWSSSDDSSSFDDSSDYSSDSGGSDDSGGSGGDDSF